MEKNSLTKEQGSFLVKLARKTLENYLAKRECSKPNAYDAVLDEKRGVFVTLHTSVGDLRGCIGYPEPITPLIDAVMDSAISAAVRDPRFPAVKLAELKDLIIEITVLTKPELIKIKSPDDYLQSIEIGVDGLIAEQGFNRGLLLPQVAPEWGWGKEEFLQHTCMKAGLSSGAWKDLKTKMYKFQGQIFKEESPCCEVFEEK